MPSRLSAPSHPGSTTSALLHRIHSLPAGGTAEAARWLLCRSHYRPPPLPPQDPSDAVAAGATGAAGTGTLRWPQLRPPSLCPHRIGFTTPKASFSIARSTPPPLPLPETGGTTPQDPAWANPSDAARVPECATPPARTGPSTAVSPYSRLRSALTFHPDV